MEALIIVIIVIINTATDQIEGDGRFAPPPPPSCCMCPLFSFRFFCGSKYVVRR